MTSSSAIRPAGGPVIGRTAGCALRSWPSMLTKGRPLMYTFSVSLCRSKADFAGSPARQHRSGCGRFKAVGRTPGAVDRHEGLGTVEIPLASRAVRGGFWVAAGSYFNVAFGFVANLALTRILAPEHFGVFALGWFFFTLLDLRSKSGIGVAFGQRKEISGELIGSHLALDVAIGLMTLLLSVVVGLALSALGYPQDLAWVIVALSMVGVIDASMHTAWILLDKELHLGRSSLIASAVFPLSYAPAFWLALHGGGYWSLVAQSGSYSLLLLVGMWWGVHDRLPDVHRVRWCFDRGTALELLRFGVPVGLGGIGGLLLTQFDKFLVGTFVTLSALGFYDRAYRISQWPNLLVGAVVSRAAFYTYGRLRDDPVRLQKAAVMTFWMTTTASLPLALAILVSAPDLVVLLYGDRWLPSALFLQLLVVYPLIRPIVENAGSLFTATGHPRLIALTTAIEAGVLIVAGLALTTAYGATGTCVAVAAAFCCALVIRIALVQRIVPLPLLDVFVVPAIAASLTLAAYVLASWSVDTSAWPLVARVAGKSGGVALGFVLFLCLLQPRATLGRLQYTWRLLMARTGE